MKLKVFEALGWYGAGAIIAAYALVSFSVIDSESATYQLLNLTGALGIIAISYVKRVFQPLVLNIFWLLIAAIALLRLLIT